MDIKDRILEIIRYKGINTSRFEASCGLSKGYIRKIVKTITVDKMVDIIKTYPDINPMWLATGEGDMILSENAHNFDSDAENLSDDIIRLQNDVKQLKAILEAKNETISVQRQLIEHLSK